jgi:hypothetical protein
MMCIYGRGPGSLEFGFNQALRGTSFDRDGLFDRPEFNPPPLSRPPSPPKKTGTPVKATETATLNTKTPVQQTKLSKTTPTKKKQTALVTSPPLARKTLLGS